MTADEGSIKTNETNGDSWGGTLGEPTNNFRKPAPACAFRFLGFGRQGVWLTLRLHMVPLLGGGTPPLNIIPRNRYLS